MVASVTRQVAFLRGINVGGHRKIPMQALRDAVGAAFPDSLPRTYIASGNLVLSSALPADQVATRLQDLIEQVFGFDVPVLVVSAMQLDKIVAGCPWPDAPGNRVVAYLCLSTPDIAWDKVEGLRQGDEAVVANTGVVWLYAPEGLSRSKLAARIEPLLGTPATARNLNTMRECLNMAQ